MRIVIENDEITITTGDDDFPVDRLNSIDWSCRLAAIEAMASAARLLNDEIQKSVEFYRTGKHENQRSSIETGFGFD